MYFIVIQRFPVTCQNVDIFVEDKGVRTRYYWSLEVR